MLGARTPPRRGRRGRRTGAMIRIAQERIADLFSLAEREAFQGEPRLADRYVRLARRIGMRYNVRLLPEYRELYCRGCSTFWVEGRTVRTRLRSGRRVRTCTTCGRQRRALVGPRRTATPVEPPTERRPADRPAAVLSPGWVGSPTDEPDGDEDEEA